MLGLMATAGATLGFQRDVRRDRSQRFDAAAERARSTLGARLDQHEDALIHVRNWMLVNHGATRAEFHDVASLGFADDLYPGAQAVSFVAAVDQPDLAAFEATVRAELAAGPSPREFTVHPRSSAADSFVVRFIEPLVGNELALGFDLGTDPPRRAAVEEARDSGYVVGTAPVQLVQEPGGQTGFVLVSAVYDTPTVPQTAPARRRHFIGAASMAFRVGDLFAGVLGPDPEVEVEAYDLGPTVELPLSRFTARNRLVDTDGEPTVSRSGDMTGMHRDLDLNVGDRRWRLVLTPGPGFAATPTLLPPVVAVLGTLVSILLASIVHASARARERADRLALGMTGDLRLAEERSRSILLGAPDATLVVDANGIIKVANLAAEALFGHAVDDLVGQPVEVLLPDELRELHLAHRAGYADAPRRREMGAGLELLGQRKDGSTFPVEVSLSPLLGPRAGMEIIAAVRDVSDRRATQAALQAAYDHERQTAAQLREADALKTAFLNTVSHELRTPLTAITGFTDLLLVGSFPPPQQEDYLRRVRRNAQGLSALIDDLLAFSRLDRDDLRLEPEVVDLSAAARSVVEQLAPVLDSHTLDVTTPTRVLAWVDESALTRMLTNLLTNAARYAPAGTAITVATRQHDGHAELSVTDEGPGIAVEELRRIFERFYRGAAALSARVPGTGVGLAVVRELVERSGGTVAVGSAPGGGARFVITLPVADMPPDAEPTATATLGP